MKWLVVLVTLCMFYACSSNVQENDNKKIEIQKNDRIWMDGDGPSGPCQCNCPHQISHEINAHQHTASCTPIPCDPPL